MSRHRDFKGNNIDYGDYDSQSGSFTDDECYGASPNTSALYMYDESKFGNSRDISNFLNYSQPKSLGISDECFPDHDDVFITSPVANLKKSESSASFKIQKSERATVKAQKQLEKVLPKKEEKETKDDIDLTNCSIKDASDKVETKRSKQAYDPSIVVEAYEKFRKNSVVEKPLINLVVIGHVDAGKSTLMGNLLCQLNYVSSKKLAKFKHESQKAGKGSFAFAWILDESLEERSKGITTNVSQTYFETEHHKVCLLDAPGHKDFIPKMVAGAAQADAALLVINATKGGFETGLNLGGQTREHTTLVRVLGVNNIIVAINKMDTVQWSEARFVEIQEKVQKFMKDMKLNAIYCPVSGLLGVNLTNNQSKQDEDVAIKSGAMNWYKGPKLIDLIDRLESPIRYLEKPLRLTVSDVFKPQGSSMYAVSGQIESGGLSTNPGLNKVLCMPSSLVATVKSIKMNNSNVSDESGTCSEVIVTHAFDGDHVILSLGGIEPNLNIEPGTILCNVDYPVGCTNRIRAKILIFGLKDNSVILRGFSATFYFQCLDVAVKFEKLRSVTYREGKTEVHKEKPRCLPGSCSAEVDLKLEKVICIEPCDQFKNLSKFTIRESGNTIAGGTVVKLLNPKL